MDSSSYNKTKRIFFRKQKNCSDFYLFIVIKMYSLLRINSLITWNCNLCRRWIMEMFNYLLKIDIQGNRFECYVQFQDLIRVLILHKVNFHCEQLAFKMKSFQHLLIRLLWNLPFTWNPTQYLSWNPTQ